MIAAKLAYVYKKLGVGLQPETIYDIYWDVDSNS